MRILAIDPGTVRCGLAVSDPLGLFATPLGVVPVGDGRGLAAMLVAKAVEVEARAILVGHPRNLDGSEGPRARACSRLADELRALTDLPVTLVDERLTSIEAEQRLREAGRKGRKLELDAAAAAVLLQGYLDRVQG
jgi:putative Holliday junction resolvase